MSVKGDSSRVWLITGSSQGLGRALLDNILAAGERVVATLRKTEQLEALKNQYPATQLLILRLDVTNASEIDYVFEETRKTFGRLDIVVNNAAYVLSSEIETTPIEEARKQLDVLLWGPVQICQQSIKFFRDVNAPGIGGHILNISSAGGYRGNASTAFYHTGKFALEGFTESLAREVLPEWNIRATIVEPGGFRTGLGATAVRLPTLDYYKQDHAPSQAMSRIRDPKAFIGDPAKAGQVLYKLGGRRDLPMRVQLGTDASRLVRYVAKKTMEDTMDPEWEEIADSTNVDGVDKETVLQRIEAAWRKV